MKGFLQRAFHAIYREIFFRVRSVIYINIF